MSMQIRDPRFVEVVGGDRACEKVAGGFEFTEGPLWNAQEQCLLFTDIPGNRILRWTEAGGVTTWREPSHMANGLAFDRQRRLIACEHATSRVTRTESDGAITVLASHYGQQELNSPNDVVVRSDGAIYFTDPGYGRMAYYGVARAIEQPCRGVYRIDPSGELALLADDFVQPNGLCFSADEATLWINDTEGGHIRSFEVRAEGTLGGGRIWAQLTGDGAGAPDGMKMDSQGHLYCTGPGGIHVFDQGANCLGVIGTPEGAANFTWGGADLRSLLITATHGLYRLHVKVPGVDLGL